MTMQFLLEAKIKIGAQNAQNKKLRVSDTGNKAY